MDGMMSCLAMVSLVVQRNVAFETCHGRRHTVARSRRHPAGGHGDQRRCSIGHLLEPQGHLHWRFVGCCGRLIACASGLVLLQALASLMAVRRCCGRLPWRCGNSERNITNESRIIDV